MPAVTATSPSPGGPAPGGRAGLADPTMAQLVVETRALLDAVAVEIGDYRLWVRAEPRARRWDEEVVRPILEGDEYELEPLRAAGHHPRTVLDVGAHIGAFTLKVKRFWPRAQVIAAEPDPESAALLARNVGALGGVSIYPGALLGRPGARQAHLRQGGANDDRNAAASRLPEVIEPLAGDRAVPPATALVEACDVVDLLARHGDPEIDLLKLDCEGAEAEILERLAAADRMRRIGWVRGEWHFLPNLPRLAAALAPTHVFNFHRGDAPWGAFIAHRKPGIDTR